MTAAMCSARRRIALHASGILKQGKTKGAKNKSACACVLTRMGVHSVCSRSVKSGDIVGDVSLRSDRPDEFATASDDGTGTFPCLVR